MKTLIIVFLSIFPFKLDANSFQETLPLIQQKTIQKVLKSEGISLKNCYEEQVITTPLNTEQTIIVIPEIKEGNEDEGYYIINAKIIIVNTQTGKVISRYFKEELGSHPLFL